MQNLSLLMRKEHAKKNIKTKYISTSKQHLNTALANPIMTALAKMSPKGKPKKNKQSQRPCSG